MRLKGSSKHIMLLLLVVLWLPANGQQLPIFSQYVMNGFILNPAMAGYDGFSSVNTTTRQQWIGFRDAPQTYSASWQTRILQRSHRIVGHPIRERNMLLPSTKGRVGLGGYVINDSNGNMARTGLQFTYGYHIIMDNHQLSFGLAGKLFQYRIADENLTFGRDDDPLVNAGIRYVGYIPDIDVGIYWTNTTYFIGASVNNLLQSQINGGDNALDIRVFRHYWLMAGYKFPVSSNIAVEPNIMLKTTEQWIPQGDIGVRLYFIEDFWAGLAFRTDGSMISLLGMRSNGLFIGYAFDISFSSIQRFNYGTHELSLSFKFGDDARRYRWLRRY
jgi:type IX secretion system PorP/SprF family membrane protein